MLNGERHIRKQTVFRVSEHKAGYFPQRRLIADSIVARWRCASARVGSANSVPIPIHYCRHSPTSLICSSRTRSRGECRRAGDGTRDGTGGGFGTDGGAGGGAHISIQGTTWQTV